MKKQQMEKLRQYVGDMSSLFGVKEVVFNDGKARGMRGLIVNNGNGIELTVSLDRCMDIPYLQYKGVNIGFVSKVGLVAPQYYVEDGARGFLKNFTAGLLTTCGINYAGAPCTFNGRDYGLHGAISNTPAENVNHSTYFNGDDLVINISGSMRQACVFGENLVLTRNYAIETERNVIHIHDTIENQGFKKEITMNIFHINFGYPMVDEGDRLYFSANTVKPRDEHAAEGIDEYDLISGPIVGNEEQCYFHTDDVQKEQFAMIHNPKLGLAAVVHYDSAKCPLLCEWKCMRAGEYVVGLEPTNSGVLGLQQASDDNMLKYIEPGSSIEYDVEIEIIDDGDKIKTYMKNCKEYSRK